MQNIGEEYSDYSLTSIFYCPYNAAFQKQPIEHKVDEIRIDQFLSL